MHENSRFTVWAETWAKDDEVVWELVLTVRSDDYESSAPVAHALARGLTLDEAQEFLDNAMSAVGLQGNWRRAAAPEGP